MLHCRVLTDRTALDGKLPPRAKTRFIGGQKERHGGHLFYRSHPPQWGHLIAGCFDFRRLCNRCFENIGEGCAGMNRVAANL